MKLAETPDRIYGALFERVQTEHLFADSKTFVDAIPRVAPSKIVATFEAQQARPDFDLEAFVSSHFELPGDGPAASRDGAAVPVEERIDELWNVLTRDADVPSPYSSLIPLPNPYVVPGGRFREVYYWDSYFTMLGLADTGRIQLIEDMVENFSFLIDRIGFIPNGNRNYYCSRSQPPVFALMVELLAAARGDPAICRRYHPKLLAEHRFWMGNGDTRGPHRRLVVTGQGTLNRYFDDSPLPRQESYAEDVLLAERTSRDRAELFRDIRAACESGWDFSSRWLSEDRRMESIRTTAIVPVDLNALLYNLETMLADNCRALGDSGSAEHFGALARRRRRLLQTLFYDDSSGMFTDLLLPDLKPSTALSLAGAYPLFFGIATSAQAARSADAIDARFLKDGGWVTTLEETGQQWDAPNGWAPMQWITFRALERYGYVEQAEEGARRWVQNNLDVYRRTGRLFEKYDVVTPGAGRGGEYKVQDGFGWTNAVLLRFMRKLRIGGKPDAS